MPQVLIEISRDVSTVSSALIKLVHEAVGSTGDFRLSGTTTRLQIFDHYIAGAIGLPSNGFVSVTLKVKTGRSDEALQAVAKAIFDAIAVTLVPLIGSPVSVNVDVQLLHASAMRNEVLTPGNAPDD